MVKKLWPLIFFVGISCAASAMAEVRFSLKAEKKSIALGEPLIVELKAEDARDPLSSVNLDQLKQNFNVFGISSNVKSQTRKGRTTSHETMTLTLYALRSGKLQVPALSYMKKSSKPLLITVTEAGPQTSRVIIKTNLDTAQPLVRLASTLTLDIYDDGSLQWTAPRELLLAGAHQRKLAESQFEEMVEGSRYTVHRYAWAVMPLREGVLTAEFPLLDAFKFGTRLRYPVAPLKLEVQAVPAYLPVHVPIGKLQVSAEPLPEEIALDRPVNWTIRIQGSGISEEGLHKLLSAIHSDDTLRFYPAQISRADNERASSASQTLLVTVPLVPLQTGTVYLPEINLPYYDPASARLESILLPAARLEVFNPLWLLVQKIALGIILLISLSAAGYGLYRKIRLMQKKQRLLQAIRSATSAEALHLALLKFDLHQSSAQNLTLQQWLQHMKLEYEVDEQLVLLVQKLASAQYGLPDTQANIAELAQEAGGLLRNLAPRKTNRRKRARNWRIG